MHILSLQVTASHYTRTINPHRQYLDFADQVSMTWLYDRYREWLADEHPGNEPVKESYYTNIFNTCYNINSSTPKVDVCAICNRLGIRITEAKDVGRDCSQLINELTEHKEKASVAYTSLSMATEEQIWNPND